MGNVISKLNNDMPSPKPIGVLDRKINDAYIIQSNKIEKIISK